MGGGRKEGQSFRGSVLRIQGRQKLTKTLHPFNWTIISPILHLTNFTGFFFYFSQNTSVVFNGVLQDFLHIYIYIYTGETFIHKFILKKTVKQILL